MKHGVSMTLLRVAGPIHAYISVRLTLKDLISRCRYITPIHHLPKLVLNGVIARIPIATHRSLLSFRYWHLVRVAYIRLELRIQSLFGHFPYLEDINAICYPP